MANLLAADGFFYLYHYSETTWTAVGVTKVIISTTSARRIFSRCFLHSLRAVSRQT